MQEFSSADARHDFSVDGARYYLPALGIDDIPLLGTFSEMDREERPGRMKAELVSRVRSHRGFVARMFAGEKSAQRAVEEMSLDQVASLFKGWAGMEKAADLGESSSSPAVPTSTPASSSQTSQSSSTGE